MKGAERKAQSSNRHEQRGTAPHDQNSTCPTATGRSTKAQWRVKRPDAAAGQQAAANKPPVKGKAAPAARFLPRRSPQAQRSCRKAKRPARVKVQRQIKIKAKGCNRSGCLNPDPLTINEERSALELRPLASIPSCQKSRPERRLLTPLVSAERLKDGGARTPEGTAVLDQAVRLSQGSNFKKDAGRRVGAAANSVHHSQRLISRQALRQERRQSVEGGTRPGLDELRNRPALQHEEPELLSPVSQARRTGRGGPSPALGSVGHRPVCRCPPNSLLEGGGGRRLMGARLALLPRRRR